ncbi:hypothetical protein BH09BAC3_BH09BAC3_26450 [soil metagenome]
MSITEQLYNHCLEYVRSRIVAAEDAILDAQLSANEETKSSAGDKYETGRAMAQLEIEKNTVQLNESRKLLNALEQIQQPKGSASRKIQIGSVAVTNQGNYYVAISAGKFLVNRVEYFAISPAAPIGKLLIGCLKGDRFDFNGRKFVVEDVF